MLVKQPYDCAVIEEIALDDASSVERKLEAASRAFANRGCWLPKQERIAVLRRLRDLVADKSESFAVLIAREAGKPLIDARIEVTRAIQGIERGASEIEHLGGEEIVMGITPADMDRWAFTTREPIGVVAAISAFNHPLNLVLHQIVPAIATGCPVLIKPALTTPLNCLQLVSAVHQAGLPEAWCQVVLAEDNEAEKLATDSRVSFLTFIGSSRVGWHLRSRIAAGTRCALEHGGIAPVLVDRTADLERVASSLTKGAYYHAGQVCVSVQRIFVHEDVKEELCHRLGEKANALKVGDPTAADTEIGPLIREEEVTRVNSWVKEALQQGGRLATGGERIGATCYRPTLIVDPPRDARVSTEEIFGPVACLYGYRKLDEALAEANRLPFAFQAAIFSNDMDIVLSAARALNASTVMVNDHTAFRTDWMPFAGRKQSGLGTGGIPYTMRDMTQEKMIVLRS